MQSFTSTFDELKAFINSFFPADINSEEIMFTELFLKNNKEFEVEVVESTIFVKE